jgi:hypothetical protein
MIQNHNELQVMLERIRRIHDQLSTLRRVETNATNYRLSSSGLIAQLDRMQLEVREYLASPPKLAAAG